MKEDFLREVLRRKLFGNSESSWMKFEAWSTAGSENGASKIAIEWTIDLLYMDVLDSPFSDKPTSFQTLSKLIECDHLPQ